MQNDVATLEAVTQVVPANTPMAMLAAAVAKGVDTEQLTKLMELQERWEKNEAHKAFNAAFSNFKAEAVEIIKRTEVKDGPLKGKFHADLFDVVSATIPALSKHGLTTSWKLTKDEKDWMEVTCILRHSAGHSESVSMSGAPDTGPGRNSIQARGSTKTYLERYTLTAILGMAPKDADDDGGGTDAQGLPQAQYDAFAKEITDCIRKDKAKEVWRRAVTVCATLKDVKSAEKLKAVLLAHGKFIDNADKVVA